MHMARELLLLGVPDRGGAEGPPLHWRTGGSRERGVGCTRTLLGVALTLNCEWCPCAVQLKLEEPLPFSLMFFTWKSG